MSAGPENRFRTSINRALPASLHQEKMHNPYRGGTFDDWYSGKKADIWVEYKWKKLNLSPLQLKWGRERHAEGRRVYVVVGREGGGELYKSPDQWEHGEGSPTSMTKKEIVAWIVEQTMGQIDASNTETRRRRSGAGQRIQNPNHGGADL